MGVRSLAKFVSRHSRRDDQLAAARDKLLKAALDDLSEDPDVIAIYLAGSLAKGDHDRYSDIDLHTVVRDGAKAKFIENKLHRPSRWGEVLFFEDSAPNSPLVVVHFDNFIKVDTWYHEAEEIQPSVWHAGNVAVYDPAGLLEPVFDESNRLEYSPSAQEVDEWRGKIFAYIHETYRSVMRGELYDASSMLDSFRWQMTRGWYMEAGLRIDASRGVWSNVEGKRSKLEGWQSALLHSWYADLDEAEIMKTVTSIVPEFLRLNTRLCEMTGLEERRDWCLRVISKVL